jgi:hypothetical protein
VTSTVTLLSRRTRLKRPSTRRRQTRRLACGRRREDVVLGWLQVHLRYFGQLPPWWRQRSTHISHRLAAGML